jgi:Protein of unknown function (DUF1812).
MKNTYSVSKLLMSLLGIMLAVQSCIKPDMDDCDPHNVKVVIQSHTEASRSVADPEIENATLYLFDQSGVFVDAATFSSYTPGRPYEAEFNLAPGFYKFVVWTNTGQTYTTTHSVEDCHGQKPQWNDMTLAFNYTAGSSITEDLPDLHHGHLAGAEVKTNTNHLFPITLIPNTYRVNFIVKGLTATTDDYAFEVRDDNSHYDFENSIIAGKDEFCHLRNTRFSDDELAASMTVLRLTDGRAPQFDFTNTTTSETLYSADLVDMIRRAYQKAGQTLDFNTQFEFTLILRFDAQLGVTVSIPGWDYIPNPGEID